MRSFFFFFFFLFIVFDCLSKGFEFSEKIQISRVGKTIHYPWGMSLLNEKQLIITSKKGEIFLANLEKYDLKKIHEVKETNDFNQGGLLDILFVKSESINNIFVCYYNKLDSDLVIAKYILKTSKLLNKKVIFKSNFKNRNGKHFGCRLVNYKNTLLATLGDRGKRNNSQNPKNYPGSIVQLSLNGKKLGHKNDVWLKGIYSIGHRNPQGLIYIKEFDEIWSHEHGPKGGDEINIIYKGSNYGWPMVTYGKEYWGGSIGDGNPKEGMTEPVWTWIPSIAPSGMDLYKNDYFKSLNNTMLIGSLKFKSLYGVKIENKRPSSEFVIFKNKIGRIRDVLVHPKGFILLLNDEYSGGLYKMEKK